MYMDKIIRKDYSFSYPVLNLPPGETEESIWEFLAGYCVEDATEQEMINYLREDFKRFLYTLSLVSEGEGNLLEIGANPYYTSVLLKQFTRYNLFFTNYFGEHLPDDEQTQYMINATTGNKMEFTYQHFNFEKHKPPYEKNFFDMVLCCEVIEHMTSDPLQMLLQIKSILKKGGYLVLSTPNVARFENIARMLSGANIYDPYSGHGEYGRHNREYTRHELHLLLTHLGFEIEKMFTTDVHVQRSALFFDMSSIYPKIKSRKDDLGQYIFVKAKNSKEANIKKPDWLFRSYPPEEMHNNC